MCEDTEHRKERNVEEWDASHRLHPKGDLPLGEVSLWLKVEEAEKAEPVNIYNNVN